MITHGWPGSVAEFLEIIGPLTDPRGHGADPAVAFHVVAPSLPGFGFSGPTTEPGWDVPRIARAWAELMARLGYDRYGAQGGDWGGHDLPRARPGRPGPCRGVHLNRSRRSRRATRRSWTAHRGGARRLAGLERYRPSGWATR